MTQAGPTGAAAEFVVLCDAGDVIRFINRQFAAFLGAPAARCLAHSFAPDGGDGAPGDSRVFRTKAPGAEGQGHNAVEWRLEILDSGEKLYVGSIVATVGPARPADETTIDARMQVISTVSHEMRTPLNGILGMSALLLDTSLTLNQRAYVEAMRESGANLLSLINDILDFSKLDAGKVEFEKAPFDPYALAQGVVELLSPRAAEKEIEIASYVAPSTPRRLIGDEARIRQILLNLAGNAVKFTNVGGVCVELLMEEKAGAARLIGHVRDTGVGISSAAAATVFERYMQADNDAGRRAQGTGLGLAIARRLARAMGGDIEVASTPGVGSVFTFHVECGAGAERPAPPRVAAPPVVIASRSDLLTRALGLQLDAFGARDVTICTDIAAAAAALGAKPGSILLCDFPLVSNEIASALNAATRSLVLLAPTQRSTIEDLRARGFDGYLVKPIRQSTLMREVARRTREGAPAGPIVASAATRPLRVLLAEDNQINAVLATTLIRRAGHKVDVAPNGEEAIRAAASGGYDVVFMDMHMPVMDGLEASRSIRALSGPASGIPIVALTANATATDRQRCMAAGMNDFLPKPFEAADLTRMLTKWGADVPALDAAS